MSVGGWGEKESVEGREGGRGGRERMEGEEGEEEERERRERKEIREVRERGKERKYGVDREMAYQEHSPGLLVCSSEWNQTGSAGTELQRTTSLAVYEVKNMLL